MTSKTDFFRASDSNLFYFRRRRILVARQRRHMRLWSIHPMYLDSKGLVALWREALLAQAALLGHTKGYKNHPQLNRFKLSDHPAGAIASYLRHVADEADKRRYNFNRSKIANKGSENRIVVTSGQVEYEFKHLLGKLKKRDIMSYRRLKSIDAISVHPLFIKTTGSVEDWEKL